MMQSFKENKQLLLYAFSILLIAIATYGVNYYNPAAVFWDENYHIASAQKYIAGVMYMEPHPPLGKLFIALGEWLLHPNDALDLAYFTQTDYIKTFPDGYSFAGVRLFPVFFGAGSGVLFFLTLYLLSRHLDYAFLFSALYLFENAFILQSRSAMLESTQMFFILLSIVYFVYLFNKSAASKREYFILGLFMGLAFMVKANGLILTLLYPFLFLYHHPFRSEKTVLLLKRFILNGVMVVAGLLTVITAIFYVHFALGKTVHKSYKASSEYKQILQKGTTANPMNYWIMLKDNLVYMSDYSKGVPRYDPCKKGENGSLTATWPFGNKTINYRWAKKDGKVSYLYLHGNPVIWFSVVIAIVLATVLIIGRFVYGLQIIDRRLFYLIGVFTTMYWSYMIVMFNIERVMYLYHYFIALFFGTFVLFLLFNYLYKEAIERDSKLLYWTVVLFVIEIVYIYWFFGPLTYYNPLSTLEFVQRQWFDFWKLQPVL